jgi:hypothetical protein
MMPYSLECYSSALLLSCFYGLPGKQISQQTDFSPQHWVLLVCAFPGYWELTFGWPTMFPFGADCPWNFRSRLGHSFSFMCLK